MMAGDGKAVFLSYAREDTDAAKRIADALRAFGVDAWFDQSELRGGDTWDQKIRDQIRTCALFMPIISACTQQRHEGYFRREWKLAVERTHDMAAGVAFIVPVVIDETSEAEAAVPEEFLRYQWTRLAHGVPTPQFVEQVKRLLESPKTAGSNVARVSRPVDETITASARASPRRRILAAAVIVAVVGIGAAFFLLRKPAPAVPAVAAEPAPATRPAAAAPAPPATDKSVAVLAFVDLSEGHNSEYLSDGISEELLNVLAKIPDLRVGARTSAFSFKGKNAPIPEIAQKLNVAYIVEGSVQRAGDRVKITAQLIKAVDGFHIWSDTFTREMKDVFAVEEEIAGLIAKNLSLKLGMTGVGVPAVVAPTKNPEAYEAYLRGRAAQSSGFTERTNADAIRYYQEAVRLDPNYALAWARLAEMSLQTFRTSYDRSDGTVARAHSGITTAVRLVPDLPEAHLVQAKIRLLMDHEPDAARQELDEVARLRPNDPELAAARAEVAYTIGPWNLALGDQFLRAAESDPQNSDTQVTMAAHLAQIGRFADADRLCDRAAASGAAMEEVVRLQHSNLLAWTGDTRAALRLLERTPAPAREWGRFYAYRASLREKLRDFSGALADLQHFRSLVTGDFATRSGPRQLFVVECYAMGRIEGALGHADRAEQYFRQVLTEAEAVARDFPGLPPIYAKAYALARLGRSDEALAVVDQIAADIATGRVLASALNARRTRADVLAILGRKAEAIAELRAVHEAGYGFGYELRGRLDFETLRDEPAFQQLAADAEARANAQRRPKP